MGYSLELLKKMNAEFSEFKRSALSQSKEEIFADAERNLFFTIMHDYFNLASDFGLDDEELQFLMSQPDPIGDMWLNYCDSVYCTLSDSSETRGFICKHIEWELERNKEDEADEGTEM